MLATKLQHNLIRAPLKVKRCKFQQQDLISSSETVMKYTVQETGRVASVNCYLLFGMLRPVPENPCVSVWIQFSYWISIENYNLCAYRA